MRSRSFGSDEWRGLPPFGGISYIDSLKDRDKLIKGLGD
jgi:hypothetical protein